MADSNESAAHPDAGGHYNWLHGPNGLRAGWRLAIFFAIFIPLGYGVGLCAGQLLRSQHADRATPLGGILTLGPFVPALLLASWIMGKIEGRGLAAYGLPWRRAFGRQFWQGAAFGFLSLTALLLAMKLAGVLSFGQITLPTADTFRYAVAWAVPLFLAALLEDFTYRGYLLFTLSTGIGFWPAAIVTSLLMGGIHYFNPGGHGLGPVAATMYCLVTVLVLRRTGDLWMPLGIHWAWGWGEIFFYGVTSSGFTARGHLLATSVYGPQWLSGGAFGPEASVLNLALLLIWWIIFSRWLRGVKYPNPDYVRKPRIAAASA